ncbi:AEH_G0027170.mRNA.1.CDS.1 [Saccharomyces cerevisiae]|nr:Prm2p [Saccharomyces cerevisiae R103]CAI4408516.1 AEH_G0027170.mRNA.1.CDS.1 [Saccharomyces cerevisiae]CAI6607578.1 AEH_G0027170.mRNA.1.CDS.1 [Saccharomyces cerevisiae]
MNNVHIIKPLSLPQRFFSCIFHPLLLIFFTSVILTIWGSFSVIDITMAKMSHAQVKRNDTVSTFASISTATATATTTATTTATMTAVTTQHAIYSANSYSLNKTFIDNTIDQYFESKLRSIESTVGTDMQEKFKSYTDDILDNKQKLINDQISLETELIKEVLEVNNTIFNELLTKSQLINDTWNEISEDAMTIDKDSISQMASNLLLNYCMFDSIFGNYSRKLKSLQNFNGTITDFSTQLDASSTLSLNFLRNSTDWLQLKRNFTANLQNEISILSGGSTEVTSSTSIIKRSLKTNSEENSVLSAVKNNVFRKCKRMTIIFTVMYFAFVILLMAIERILFQLENQQANLVMSQINGLTGQTNFTKYNKVLKSLITTLNLSTLYPIPYQLTKLINQKIFKREPEKIDDRKVKKSKLFYCNWWIISNGAHLWLFGFLMLLIHWQIVTRLTNFEVPSLPTFHKRAGPSLYKREVWTDGNITTTIEGFINDSVSLLCENFQMEVDEKFITADLSLQTDPNLKVQSTDILNLWVNDTNTQYEKYLNENSQNWQGINLQVEPLLGSDSINEFLGQYFLPTYEVTNTNSSFALDIQKYGIINRGINITNASVAALSSLSKRQIKDKEQKQTYFLHTVYKWGLLAVCLTILFHHMLIFIILKL